MKKVPYIMDLYSPGLLIRPSWTHNFPHETAKLWYNSTIRIKKEQKNGK